MKVYVDSHLNITEYTKEEASIIKEELKKDNPAFASAKLYSPYARVAVPKYLYYYSEDRKNKVLKVPRGYKIPFDYELTGRLECNQERVSFPEFNLDLRDAQAKAVNAYISQLEKNSGGDGMIVMPTGSGKTITGLKIASLLGYKTLVVVNKDDLIAGWKDDAKLCFGEKFKCGLIKAKKFDLGEQITLATIQTLAKLPEEKLNIVKNYFNVVIVDEQHRAAANSYSFISNLPAYYRLGFTATDMRNDGLRDVLDFYFKGVVFRCSDADVEGDIISAENIEVEIKETDIYYHAPKNYRWKDDSSFVTELELLKPHKIITRKDREWDGAIKELLANGEITQVPLNLHKVTAVVNADTKFMEMVINDIYYEFLKEKSCVVFCKEKALVEQLHDLLIAKGVDEDEILLYYGGGKVTKQILKERAEPKTSLITITTLAMSTEGTNVKAWERLFLVSSIANKKDLIQAIGRVRRVVAGKDNVKIYDYAHPNVDSLWRHIEVRKDYYEEKNFKITCK